MKPAADPRYERLRAGCSAVSRSRLGSTVVALTFVLGGALVYWAYQREADDGERFGLPPGSAASPIGYSVGTIGFGEPREVEGGGGAPAVSPPAIIQELDTITGSVDGQELIGRRVDLHVVVQAVPNDVGFWIGEKDNRVLVVLSRDNRNEQSRAAATSHPAGPRRPVRCHFRFPAAAPESGRNG